MAIAMTEVICNLCNRKLEKRKVKLKYMKYYMEAELLQCPACGQVYISEELAEGKISQVEKSLEEK